MSKPEIPSVSPSNFLRQIVQSVLDAGKHVKIVTRFPPVPNGYLDQPTIVNNVETFAAAAMIALNGGDWYAGIGTRQSAGTTIAHLRAQGAASPLGDQTAATVDALVTGFTDATRWALLIATAFLLLGLAGAWRLRRAAGAASPQVR